jgi:hypothetical protein
MKRVSEREMGEGMRGGGCCQGVRQNRRACTPKAHAEDQWSRGVRGTCAPPKVQRRSPNTAEVDSPLRAQEQESHAQPSFVPLDRQRGGCSGAPTLSSLSTRLKLTPRLKLTASWGPLASPGRSRESVSQRRCRPVVVTVRVRGDERQQPPSIGILHFNSFPVKCLGKTEVST